MLKRFKIAICFLIFIFAFTFSSCRESGAVTGSDLRGVIPKITVIYSDGYTTYLTYNSFLFKNGTSYKIKDSDLVLTLNSQGEKVTADSEVDTSQDEVTDTDVDDELLGDLPLGAMTKRALSEIPTVIQNFEVIGQFPNFPTGCESVSTVMVLQFLGLDISSDEFVDKYLDKSYSFYYKNGKLMGPDPYKYFVGNPREKTSFGCMAPVIKKALDKVLDKPYFAKETTGKTLEELSEEYIDKGVPVIVWITSQMLEVKYIRSWGLYDGGVFNWPTNEHCAVFIGYDENSYYFADPYFGYVFGYEKELVKDRFESMGQQSVVIEKLKEESVAPLPEIW